MDQPKNIIPQDPSAEPADSDRKRGFFARPATRIKNRRLFRFYSDATIKFNIDPLA